MKISVFKLFVCQTDNVNLIVSVRIIAYLLRKCRYVCPSFTYST